MSWMGAPGAALRGASGKCGKLQESTGALEQREKSKGSAVSVVSREPCQRVNRQPCAERRAPHRLTRNQEPQRHRPCARPLPTLPRMLCCQSVDVLQKRVQVTARCRAHGRGSRASGRRNEEGGPRAGRRGGHIAAGRGAAAGALSDDAAAKQQSAALPPRSGRASREPFRGRRSRGSRSRSRGWGVARALRAGAAHR